MGGRMVGFTVVSNRSRRSVFRVSKENIPRKRAAGRDEGSQGTTTARGSIVRVLSLQKVDAVFVN